MDDPLSRAGYVLPPPKPGTEDAIAKGCTCPVIDNHYGHGYHGQAGVFVYTVGCPVHGTNSTLFDCYDFTLSEPKP